jgi:hypothetical protein
MIDTTNLCKYFESCAGFYYHDGNCRQKFGGICVDAERKRITELEDALDREQEVERQISWGDIELAHVPDRFRATEPGREI